MNKSIYLGGIFYQFTAEEVRKRQGLLETRLDPSIKVLKPKHGDDYPEELGEFKDTTLTMRDRHMVKSSSIIVLDLLQAEKPPRGILIEAGWANAWDIPIMLLVDPQSPYKFNMLNNLVTWEVSNYDDAACILNSMLMD